ncbi:hypothetical protein G7047_29110 [Diaphorobacter sp. HDW4A]|uniref:metallophosphoesterase family protein n=1 Tax=Diaphorobacter sp. HDW4A TaxID=2714924 RepID=UPI00140800C6|nr:choice-of-anchor U domain-containing protein [Diaphorobacter sp. HDW4A]QIL83549.1 hypothetical protein G7047_29110 [Diaphorobacter sp. HDW4A]
MQNKWRLLWLAGTWAVCGLAQAQTTVLQEQNFDTAGTGSTISAVPPAGWTVKTFYSDGSVDEVKPAAGFNATWLGWRFVTSDTWKASKSTAASTKRGDFSKGTGGIAIIESDGLRAEKVYSTSLLAPSLAVTAAKRYVVSFDTHYRQGQSPQTADVTITFDKGDAVARSYTADTLNQGASVEFTAPAGATTAQVSWNYRSTANNWYWALDNVKLHRDDTPPAGPFDPAALPNTAAKPVMAVGPTLQNPGTDRMSVMLETAESAPTVWVRKVGSTGPFTIVNAVNAAGDFKDANIFFADLTGLASNTLYEYAVVTGTSATPKLAGPYRFKTWPRASDKVTSAKFATVSDTQDGLDNRFKNIVNGLIANDCGGQPEQCAEALAGFVVPGDLVASGNSRSNWAAHFFTPLSALSAYVPLLPAAGNHEYFGEQASAGAEKSWMKTYRKYFNRLPSNGSEQYPLHWYSIDYLGLRIVASDFNPASAMHNTGGWTNYDNGRGLFRADYMKAHLDWFTGLMKSTREEAKPYVLLLNHHPCLSEKWRQGEVIAACDFISQLEDYGRGTGAITANVNGHVHFYERGNSMNSRHLWLNVASGSGGLESAKQEDDTDLDVIANAKLAFGYGTLQFSFDSGAAPSLEWKRYDLSGTAISASANDAIRVTSERFAASPQLPEAKLGKVDPATVQLRYALSGAPAIYEAQWQLSKSRKFDTGAPVYDVWGNGTRRENWTYLNNARVNTQKDADISTLALGQLLAHPKRVYPNVGATTKRGKLNHAIIAGGNSLRDRWSCAYKWDEDGDTGGTDDPRQGGRQCFARLTQANGEKGSEFDPFDGKAPEVLSFGSDERWYWRVRVRDEHLNWSDWSTAGSFELGNPVPEPTDPVDPPEPQVLIDAQLPSPGAGLPGIGLNVQSLTSCKQVTSSGGAVPAGLLPEGQKAVSGLIAFSLLDCATPGFEASIVLTLPAPPPTGSKLMKVSTDANGKKIATEITHAILTGNTVSYRVTDGGALDEDGLVNAAIIDPVLIASPAAIVTPPITPTVQPVPVDHPLMLALVALLVGGWGAWRQRRARA